MELERTDMSAKYDTKSATPTPLPVAAAPFASAALQLAFPLSKRRLLEWINAVTLSDDGETKWTMQILNASTEDVNAQPRTVAASHTSPSTYAAIILLVCVCGIAFVTIDEESLRILRANVRLVCAAAAIGAFCFFTAGGYWTLTRRPPLLQVRNGRVALLHPNAFDQFAGESLVAAAFNLMISACFIIPALPGRYHYQPETEPSVSVTILTSLAMCLYAAEIFAAVYKRRAYYAALTWLASLTH